MNSSICADDVATILLLRLVATIPNCVMRIKKLKNMQKNLPKNTEALMLPSSISDHAINVVNNIPANDEHNIKKKMLHTLRFAPVSGMFTNIQFRIHNMTPRPKPKIFGHTKCCSVLEPNPPPARQPVAQQPRQLCSQIQQIIRNLPISYVKHKINKESVVYSSVRCYLCVSQHHDMSPEIVSISLLL